MRKEKITWKNKLAIKIPLINTLVAVLVITAMCVSVSVLSTRLVSKQVEKEVENLARINADKVQSYVDKMNVFSSALASEISLFDDFDRTTSEHMLQDSLLGVLEDDAIFSAYYAFEPNAYFSNTPKGLSYYAFRDGDSVKMEILNDYDVYNTSDYYAPSKATGVVHVTEPYSYQLATGETVWLISLCRPITNAAGRFIGVVNCDILADDIAKLDFDTGGYQSTISYIMTGQGTYISHTKDSATIGTTYAAESETEKQILEAAKNGKGLLLEGTNPYESGKKTWVIHTPITIKGTDLVWSSAFAVNKSEALKQVYFAVLLLILFSLLALSFLASFSFISLKRALKPIGTVVGLAQQMGRCDLKNIHTVVSTKDELGELASIFSETSVVLGGYISEVSELLGQIAAGNLNAQIEREYIGDFTSIQLALTNILSSLNDMFIEIKSVSNQVSMGADQVASGAQALAQGATEQAGSIEELSTSISDISAQIKQSAADAQAARQKADLAGQELQTSNEQMQHMVRAMDDITQKSSEISKIIKIIDDIAFQTNILALNAAVEAARAGTAGKGFAVVADEVRILAGKSAEAAKNTNDLIAETLRAVKNGSQIATQTAAALDKSATETHAAIEFMEKIAQASNNQAAAILSINEGVDQISAVVQTNAGTAEESAAASQELSSLSNALQELIARFRLKDAESIDSNPNSL